MPKKNDEAPNNDEEQVVTPGGKRRRSAVRHVKPGEMVTAEGTVEGAEEPPGMRPQSGAEAMDPNAGTAGGDSEEPPGMRPESSQAGSSEGAGTDSGEEPQGMRPASPTLGDAHEPEPMSEQEVGELVLTPGGYRHQSLVHQIEPEHVLD